jgi:thymidylate kinase/HD superfamily phosphodiesterase
MGKLISGSVSEFTDRLRRCGTRGDPELKPYASARISLERLQISDLVPLSKYVLEEQLEIVEKIQRRLAAQGVDIFALASGIVWPDGIDERAVACPVVEFWDREGLLLVDGIHRVWYARASGRKEILCAVVKDVVVPLVPLPVTWREVKVYGRGQHPAERDKRDYRFSDAQSLREAFPSLAGKVTNDNFRYFLFRDLAELGSSGVRPPPPELDERPSSEEIMTSDLELRTWQRVAGLAQSVSHDYHHIDRVQAYADALGAALGIDTALVRVAAILHDLGRGDESRRHGLSSIEASKEMAEEVLRHLPLSDKQRKIVIDAIENHDQPELHPELAAARILKDSDFLAGFGAWGILRIAMWSGETGRRIEEVLSRITKGMQRRLDSLEYSESREAALREVLFARQFHGELERPARLGGVRYPGFYCVLEGISGLGKNTVAQSLCNRLNSLKIPWKLVEEPSDTFRKIRDSLLKRPCEFVPLRKALLMTDRADQLETVVLPSLERGEVVISVRSYLSTAVYQAYDRAEAYRTMLEHDWVPTSDLLLVLDADVEIAVARIGKRARPQGEHETPDQLKAHRARYHEFGPLFPSRSTEFIDASPEAEAVSEAAFGVLQTRLEARGFRK